MCDKEYMQLYQHHYYLLATSHTSLICAIYGMRMNTGLWIIPAGVYINSVNYWRNPVRGLRRNLDMAWTVLGLTINIGCAARYSTNANCYYAIASFASLMYPISYYFYWKKQYVIATFTHSLLHVLGNIGNVCLYIGLQ